VEFGCFSVFGFGPLSGAGGREAFRMVDPKSGPEPIVVTRRDEAPIRVVKGGNHVTNLLEAGATGHAVDAISVRADAGGGPPPHRHEFGEWFHVLEGSLDITTAADDEIVTLCRAEAGDSVWVPPNAWHGTINASGGQVRFLVVGVPGTMTEYFAEAGVEVPNQDTPPSTEPPGPTELGDLPSRHGITFFHT
jgi:quercetin dioxygenase-like cupin family protein